MARVTGAAMKFYLLKLIPPRTSFPQDITAAEAGLMREHAVYWHMLARQGIAHAVGPVADPAGAYGIAVVELPDQADPQALGAGDPVVKAGVGFRFEVLPMMSLITAKSAMAG